MTDELPLRAPKVGDWVTGDSTEGPCTGRLVAITDFKPFPVATLRLPDGQVANVAAPTLRPAPEPDLAARLLAAIEETERIARDADVESPGPWKRGNSYLTPTSDNPAERQIYDATGEVVVYDEGSPGDAVVAHFMRQDPQATLRRCEADRETVDDYARTVEIRDAAAERLRTQEHPKNPRDLDKWDRAEREASILRPGVERLARAYDITTEETTHG